MSTLIHLLFTSPAAPYVTGDVAGFSEEAAAPFVDAGVARQMTSKEIDAMKAEASKVAKAAAGDDLVLVHFTKQRGSHVAGDIAGFSRELAEEIVLDGRGEIITAENVRPKAVGPEHAPALRHKEGGAYIAPTRPDLTPVRFVRSAFGYIAGELAGFDVDTARKLVENGDAEYNDRRSAPAPKTAPSADPDASRVSEDVEVVGLDDRDPNWRERQAKEKAEAEDSTGKRGGKK